MKLVKAIIGIVLSAIIGGIAGFILLLISEGVFLIVTSFIVGMIAFFFVSGMTEGMDLSKLLSVFAAVVSFVLYFCLLAFMNETCDSIILFAIVGLLPYGIFTYAALVAAESKNNKK